MELFLWAHGHGELSNGMFLYPTITFELNKDVEIWDQYYYDRSKNRPSIPYQCPIALGENGLKFKGNIKWGDEPIVERVEGKYWINEKAWFGKFVVPINGMTGTGIFTLSLSDETTGTIDIATVRAGTLEPETISFQGLGEPPHRWSPRG